MSYSRVEYKYINMRSILVEELIVKFFLHRKADLFLAQRAMF